MKTQLPTREKLALLLGSVDYDGICSALFQAGRRYKRKELHSTPDNWKLICQYFESHDITFVIAKLTGDTYHVLNDPAYALVSAELLNETAKVPHIIFVHTSLYSGESTSREEDAQSPEYFTSVSNEIRQKVNRRLLDNNIRVFRYNKNVEITALAVDQLEKSEQGLLFRIYIPNSQLWASETDRLLQLFKDYLTRIAKIHVRAHEIRTEIGVIYELYGDAELSTQSLDTQFDGFSNFLSLCIDDPENAQSILEGQHISQPEIVQILVRYAKEGKRILVDLKHEREQKVLMIRQRLESELVDNIPGAVTPANLEALIDMALPRVLETRSPAIVTRVVNSAATDAQQLTLNINPQFIQTVNAIVAQEVSGDVSFNDSDKELCRLFVDYAGKQQSELLSALRELHDKSAPCSATIILPL